MILTERAQIERVEASGLWGENTLSGLFANMVSRTPDKLAVADPPNRTEIAGGLPRRLTYERLAAATANLACVFRSLDLQPDDVVAFQLPNTVEQVVVLLAAWQCGIIVSPLPLLWREHELNTVLPLIAPKALVTSSNITGRDHEALMCSVAAENLTIRAVMVFGEDVLDGVISLDGIFSDEYAPDQKFSGADQNPSTANDVATICWAGGDTDTPCPVPRSHNQWIAAGMMTLLEADIDASAVMLSPLSAERFGSYWRLHGSLVDVGGDVAAASTRLT